MLSDLEIYEIAIQNLAENGDCEVFENSSAAHGEIVLANIFKFANKSIRMFSGEFGGEICDQPKYQSALKEFLDKKDSTFEIIFEKDPNKSSKAFNILLNYKKSKKNVSIWRLNSSSENKPKHHFAIGDSNMFRIETDVTNYSALCSFNQPKIVNNLQNKFETYLKDSIVYND